MWKIKFKKSLLFILTIFAFNYLNAQTFDLQSVSNNKNQFGFSFNKAFFSSDAEFSTFSGVFQLYFDIPVSSGLNIIGNFPYINHSFHLKNIYIGDYNYSANGFGNIFIGLQTNNEAYSYKKSIYSFGLYLPTASEEASYPGLYADYYYISKYLIKRLGIYFNYAFHKIEPEGFNYGLEIGPDLSIPTGDNNGDTELFAHYGILACYKMEKVSLNAEFVGVMMISQDFDNFGDRFVNMLNIGAQFNLSEVTPIIFYKFYFKEDINQTIDGVLGIRVNVSID